MNSFLGRSLQENLTQNSFLGQSLQENLTQNSFLSQSLQENLTQSALWEDKVAELSVGLDTDSDPPLWDLDPKDPSCEWNYDLSRKLAEKLLLLDDNNGAHHYSNPKLSQSDIFNPYALVPSSHETSLQLNATIEGGGLGNARYKTEICRNYKEKGTCLYGELCQFAHGNHELRKDVVRHNKYKTKHCQKYWIQGYCAYGPRCNFIHQIEEAPGQGQGDHAFPASRRMSLQMPPAMIKTAAQVLGMSNMVKSNLDHHQFTRPMDTKEDNLEKFPTFYPRGNLNVGSSVGPVGSGRPDRFGQRVVWPGN